MISIHALREEGDWTSSPLSCCGLYFYPRPPRGGRRGLEGPPTAQQEISIHALREEGDLAGRFTSSTVLISIHALREEGDCKNRDKISIFL